MKKSVLSLCSLFLLLFPLSLGVLACSIAGAQASDPLVFALSARELSVDRSGLEDLAGGKDALVKRLIELRVRELPPYLGIRAEKLLLHYADDDSVKSVLAEDIGSMAHRGLARVVVLNLDKVSDLPFRRRLARMAIERALRERDFAPYARSLWKSSDTEIANLAKRAFSARTTGSD